MNTERERAEHQLKLHVERIVRPIGALIKDKLKMREELYAHALDAFEHEVSKGVALERAVDRAVERLGDPVATRRELQASVGWNSRFEAWLERIIGRARDESVLGHAGRFAFWVAVLFGAFLVVLITPLKWDALTAWNPEGRATVWFAVGVNASFSCGMFFGVLIGHAGWRLTQRGYRDRADRVKSAGLVVLSAALICAIGWCFTFFLSFDLAVSNAAVRLWLPFSLPLAATALIAPHLGVKQHRPLAEWLELKIEE